MAIGVMFWACGHLLANGDLASVILFGGFFVLCGGAFHHRHLPTASGLHRKCAKGHDLMSIVIGIALYGVMAQLHGALIGVPVFQLS